MIIIYSAVRSCEENRTYGQSSIKSDIKNVSDNP